MIRIVASFILYIVIFLLGMTVMKIGLLNSAEARFKRVLYKMTDRPIKGLIAGALTTAIVQSSSAVTVITVGLVASGLIAFKQTIGVILGANIGTTITSEIATFHITHLHWGLLVVGAILLFLPNEKTFMIGAISFGIGCLFVAMNGLNTLAAPLAHLAPMKAVLQASDRSIILAALAGALFSAMIQSSSATTLIVMSLMNHGALSLIAGIAIVLGANVGTCATALLASVGSRRAARWTAYTHALFNLCGVILCLPFLPYFVHWLNHFQLAPDVKLAHSSVLFNLVTALLALPFADMYGRWAERRMRR